MTLVTVTGHITFVCECTELEHSQWQPSLASLGSTGFPLDSLSCVVLAPQNILKAVNPILLPEVWPWNLSLSTQIPLSVGAGLWADSVLGSAVWQWPLWWIFCFASGVHVAAFPSEVPKFPLFPTVRGFLSVWKLFLPPDSLPGCRSSSWNPLSLFSSLSSPYLIQKTFAWLLGSLEFSASLQKVFCRSCSTCRWILVYLWGTEDNLPILFLCHLEGLPSLPLVLVFILKSICLIWVLLL